MPVDYTTKTTQELIAIIQDPLKASERNAAIAELLNSARTILSTDTTDRAMEGGISPTRRP